MFFHLIVVENSSFMHFMDHLMQHPLVCVNEAVSCEFVSE